MSEPALQTQCILCGTCLCKPKENVLLQHQGSIKDRDFINEDDVNWLDERRLIVATSPRVFVYPKPGATECAYVTGPVSFQGARGSSELRVEFARGDIKEINFGPDTRRINADHPTDEVLSIPASNLNEYLRKPGRVVLPIHEKCLDILYRAHADEGAPYKETYLNDKPVDFSPDVAETLLKARWRLEHPCCERRNPWLGGKANSLHKLPFEMPKAYFVDPLLENHIKRLHPYLKHNGPPSIIRDLKDSELAKSQLSLQIKKETHRDNLLSRFPNEILTNISRLLSTKDLRKLCYASPATGFKLNHASIWMPRLKADMPWLFDVTKQRLLAEQWKVHRLHNAAQIDWQAIYYNCQEQSTYRAEKRTLALANRRRIWILSQKLILNGASTFIDVEYAAAFYHAIVSG